MAKEMTGYHQEEGQFLVPTGDFNGGGDEPYELANAGSRNSSLDRFTVPSFLHPPGDKNLKVRIAS